MNYWFKGTPQEDVQQRPRSLSRLQELREWDVSRATRRKSIFWDKNSAGIRPSSDDGFQPKDINIHMSAADVRSEDVEPWTTESVSSPSIVTSDQGWNATTTTTTTEGRDSPRWSPGRGARPPPWRPMGTGGTASCPARCGWRAGRAASRWAWGHFDMCYLRGREGGGEQMQHVEQQVGHGGAGGPPPKTFKSRFCIVKYDVNI